MLLDKKIFGGGIAMISVGLSLLIYLNSTVPIWTSGMSEEEAIDLAQKQQENKDFSNLAAMLSGIGFLLVLVSFGARRKKGGAKTIEKKPPA
ncbi:MAG: hypothetical protein ACT4NT_06365 [Nitrososphaerota archaeon]